MRLILLMLLLALGAAAQSVPQAGTLTLRGKPVKVYAALASQLPSQGVWRVALFDHPPTVAEVEKEAGQHPTRGQQPAGAYVLTLQGTPTKLASLSLGGTVLKGLKVTEWRSADQRLGLRCSFENGQLSLSVPLKTWQD